MAEVTIRNPRARVAFWFCIAVVLVLIAVDQRQTSGFGLLLITAGIYALAGWVSLWRKLTLRPDGFDARYVFKTRRLLWHQVEDVRVISEHRSVNQIPTFVLRYLQVTVDGKKIDLPAPHAGRFIGRDDFMHRAGLFHQIWQAQRGQFVRRA